jgi:hypothetical protein
VEASIAFGAKLFGAEVKNHRPGVLVSAESQTA